MIKGNALGRIVSGEHALDLFSEQTWLEVLAAFENAKDELIALLPEAEPEDAQEQDPTDDAVRSCATPAMWEQVSPEDMQSLDRLTQDIKRMADPLGQLYKKTPKPDEDLRSEQFLFRALTLMLSCPVPVVRNTIGEAARRGDDTLFYACEMVHNLVPEFLRALMREGRPIYLQFDSDQYGCMAQFVQMSARGRLRAATARRWFTTANPSSSRSLMA